MKNHTLFILLSAVLAQGLFPSCQKPEMAGQSTCIARLDSLEAVQDWVAMEELATACLAQDVVPKYQILERRTHARMKQRKYWEMLMDKATIAQDTTAPCNQRIIALDGMGFTFRFRIHDDSAAFKVFTRAIELGIECGQRDFEPSYRIERAYILDKRGNHRASLAEADLALSLPDAWKFRYIYSTKARFHLDAGEYLNSIAQMRKFLEEDTLAGHDAYIFGAAFAKLRMEDSACKYLSMAIQMGEGRAEPIFNVTCK